MTRLNNLSARLMCNRKLLECGADPLDVSLSYIDFATRLRTILARTLVQEPFVSRADAVRYVRMMATQRWKHA